MLLRSSTAKALGLCLGVGLGSVAAAAPAPAKKLAPGAVCVLAKPLPATTEALGKGDKHKLPKGTQLKVQAIDKAWAKVSSGETTLFVKNASLNKTCKAVAVEPGTSAPGEEGGPPADAPAPETPPAEDKHADEPVEPA